MTCIIIWNSKALNCYLDTFAFCYFFIVCMSLTVKSAQEISLWKSCNETWHNYISNEQRQNTQLIIMIVFCFWCSQIEKFWKYYYTVIRHLGQLWPWPNVVPSQQQRWQATYCMARLVWRTCQHTPLLAATMTKPLCIQILFKEKIATAGWPILHYITLHKIVFRVPKITKDR